MSDYEVLHGGKRIEFTNHALDRAEEAGLTREQAETLLMHATKSTLPPDQMVQKWYKYGKKYRFIEYFKHMNVLFTVRSYKEKVCIITLTDIDAKRAAARMRHDPQFEAEYQQDKDKLTERLKQP